jgi:hypothetical protein
MRVIAPAGRIPLVIVLVGLGCPKKPSEPEPQLPVVGEGERADDGDPRVDPSRCTGGELDLRAIIDAGVCSIGTADAGELPGPDELEVDVPNKLRVEPGGRLDFEVVLRNVADRELTLDLSFRRFLPLAPERTERVDKGNDPDPSCTLQAISTEPPPERITLPAKGELAIPCQWFANTRLVDPQSYVGSECPDFPALAAGRYRSVFVLGGGAGTTREVSVEIVVRP